MKAFKQWVMAVLLLGLSLGVCAQAYPTARPVRIIVATQAGSSADAAARMFADALSRNTGQKFIVENRGGGGGNIGLAVAAKSAPDGYTLVLGNLGGSVLNQFLYPTLDFDPEEDFEPISLMMGVPFVICVHPSFPANSLRELIAAAKAKPGTINIALDTTSVRVVNALLSHSSGATFFPVSYNGPAMAISDVLGGRVPVIIETLTAMRPLIASGKLKVLAITTRQTSELLPNVSSLAEQGVPSFGEVTGWAGLMAPKGTPPNILALLNAEMNKILAQPETRQQLAVSGIEAKSGTAQQFADFMRAERARFGPLIKAANIKAE